MDDLKLGWWVVGAALVLGVSFALTDLYLVSIFNLIAISALITASLRFVMLMGELNFATAAFVGIGAYATGIGTTVLDLPFLLPTLGSAVTAAVVAAAFGAITLRAGGAYFLLIGFAFTEAVRILYTKIDLLGGNSGMIGIFPPLAVEPYMPTLVAAVVLALLFVLWVLERSEFGTVLTGIRDNADVVRSVGLSVLAARVICFSVASAIAGVAGSLQAYVNNVISPGDFSFLLAAFALAYVKVGGEGTFIGPIFGAALLITLASYALGLGGYEHVFYGAAIVLTVLLLPEGLTGWVRARLASRRAARGPT